MKAQLIIVTHVQNKWCADYSLTTDHAWPDLTCFVIRRHFTWRNLGPGTHLTGFDVTLTQLDLTFTTQPPFPPDWTQQVTNKQLKASTLCLFLGKRCDWESFYSFPQSDVALMYRISWQWGGENRHSFLVLKVGFYKFYCQRFFFYTVSQCYGGSV